MLVPFHAACALSRYIYLALSHESEAKAATIICPGAEISGFKTPFSSRVDLFIPPQRIQQSVREDKDANETVTLQGFVQVDQLQVVLNIDGTIAPMKAGEKKYGIHVISIDPPKVVLQRGQEQWTATLDH